MASDTSSKFATAFIQIHLASILAGVIVHRTAGTVHGLAMYLFSIHLLAALIYLLNIKTTRVLKAIVIELTAKIREKT